MNVIRYEDMKAGIDPARNLVKVVEANLWMPESEMLWQPGREIRSDVLSLSLFREGTEEEVHYHERAWEVYQTLEGSLNIVFKRFKSDAWSKVTLGARDLLILRPGTWHLVDRDSRHMTQVMQIPPAISDKIEVRDEEEIEAARLALG